MPVVKHSLKGRKKMFTKQDFLDGKCTKDGLPLEKYDGRFKPKAKTSPEPVSHTSSEATTTTENYEGSVVTDSGDQSTFTGDT